MTETATDEKIAPLIPLITSHGCVPIASSAGNDQEPALAPAYLLFSTAGDAFEFLLHTGHNTAYALGDLMALTLVHPEGVNDHPRAKVSWVPPLTDAVIKAWTDSLPQ